MTSTMIALGITKNMPMLKRFFRLVDRYTILCQFAFSFIFNASYHDQDYGFHPGTVECIGHGCSCSTREL